MLFYKKVLLCISGIIFTYSALAEKLAYDEVIKSLRTNPSKTIRLLNQYHSESGPVFRSTFLLATLYQKINEHDHAMLVLRLVPIKERGMEYWVTKIVSYEALAKQVNEKSGGRTIRINKERVYEAMDQIIVNTSFFPKGLGARIFRLLEIFPNKSLRSKLCVKNQFVRDDRCN